MDDTLPGDWYGLVIICAGAVWNGPRHADQHLAEHLSAYTPVLYVDRPFSRLAARRRPELAEALREPRLRLVKPSLARLTPVVPPGKDRFPVHAFAGALTRAAVRKATQELTHSARAMIAVGPHRQMFGAGDEDISVYWAADDFVGGAALMGLSAGRLARGEQQLAERADVIVTSSPVVHERWEAAGKDPVFIPFGCDYPLLAGAREAPLPADVNLKPPVVGLIGHLSDRIDVALLEAIAQRGRSLLVVGPKSPTFKSPRLEALFGMPNVQWVGSKPFKELPSYMRAVDVGVVPYGDSAFNRSSFPLKTLEYLSAGLPVVATGLPATRWLNTNLVTIADEPEKFADAVDRALSVRASADDVRRRQSFAANHSWSGRARTFAEVLGLDIRPAEARRAS